MNDIIWQDELDQERIDALTPYQPEPSSRCINDIFRDINHNMHIAYGPDYNHVGRDKLVVEPVINYEMLIRQLSDISNLRMITCRDMLAGPPDKDIVACNIRHDVDGDLRAALQQAEIEAKYNAQSTFYILHTTHYYGSLKDGVFYRNEANMHVYKEIQALGHEIALHTDPLLFYQDYNLDGARALVDEINWLRDSGIHISGTAAHNSASTYGVNNYAIFKNRPGTLFNENRKMGILFNDKWAPLQLLDENELELSYEANDVFWQTQARVEYACLMGHDDWYYESNKHGQLKTTPEALRGVVKGKWCSQADIVRQAAGQEPGSYLLLSVHPMFYGLRHNVTTAPPRSFNQTSHIINRELGWQTCYPNTVQAKSGSNASGQEFLGLGFSNEIGMLDKPVPAPESLENDDHKLLVLGGRNCHAGALCVPAHFHCKLENRSKRGKDKKIISMKMASEDMGLSRMIGWLEAGMEKLNPDFVIIGIGADEPQWSDLQIWSRNAGFDAKHPPGDYLAVENGNVKTVMASPFYDYYRKPSDPARYETHSLLMENAGYESAGEYNAFMKTMKAVAAHLSDRVVTYGATPVFLIQECGESCGLWGTNKNRDELQDAIDTTMAAMKIILPEDACIINPYEAFMKLEDNTLTHYVSSNTWNSFSHQLISELVETCIRNTR